MYDPYNRRINYLRISVTDRCNLRCVYCMPPEGIPLMSHQDILSYDEIDEVARAAAELGVDKIRLTGGEPLVRKGIVQLVGMLSRIPGIKDLAMTTNGILLGRFAEELAQAGLHRVNVSLDTLDPTRYAEITRGGDIQQVFAGLEAAAAAHLTPIRINCVVTQSSEEPDAQLVRDFAERKGYEVRFIHLMDLESGYFEPVEGGEGGRCATCNRLRMTSNGMIKPCLFSTIGYSVREFGAAEALALALENKPACGGLNPEGRFYSIGG